MRRYETVENLRVTIVQSEIIWHNVKENLKHVETLINEDKPETDLIVLPEMFNTGFTMMPSEVSEDMNGATVKLMSRLAHDFNSDITGSIPFKKNEVFFNRLIWVKPDGEIFTYDKRHLFRMGGENKIYSPGHSKLTVNLKGWRIRPFICYDLRFPVWSRNSGLEYDLALFTANWPAVRDFHWETLLRARAIENQSFVVGVNRTGRDGNNISYNGKSSVIDYYGKVLYCADESELVKTVELSYDGLSSGRNSFPAWMDSDSFELK